MVIKRDETAYEKITRENAIADAMTAKAIQEYNIMMGILEDPREDSDEQKED